MFEKYEHLSFGDGFPDPRPGIDHLTDREEIALLEGLVADGLLQPEEAGDAWLQSSYRNRSIDDFASLS